MKGEAIEGSHFLRYLFKNNQDPEGALRFLTGMCLSFFGDAIKYLAPECPKTALRGIDVFINSLKEMREATEKLVEENKEEKEEYEFIGGISFDDVINLSEEEIAKKLSDSLSEEDRLAIAGSLKKASDLIARIDACESEEEKRAMLAQLGGLLGNDTKH